MALVAAGQQVVVLADHTKIGRDTMCQTVPTDRIDVLITDRGRRPGHPRRAGRGRASTSGRRPA